MTGFVATPASHRVVQMAYDRRWPAIVVQIYWPTCPAHGGFQAFATRDKVPRRLTGLVQLPTAIRYARVQVDRVAALGENLREEL